MHRCGRGRGRERTRARTCTVGPGGARPAPNNKTFDLDVACTAPADLGACAVGSSCRTDSAAPDRGIRRLSRGRLPRPMKTALNRPLAHDTPRVGGGAPAQTGAELRHSGIAAAPEGRNRISVAAPAQLPALSLARPPAHCITASFRRESAAAPTAAPGPHPPRIPSEPRQPAPRQPGRDGPASGACSTRTIEKVCIPAGPTGTGAEV